MSAIFSHLVGPAGRVTGIEFEADLAARARANLAGATNVEVLHGDGTTVDFDTANVIYVNAGATRPAEKWLEGLAEGGRLIIPFTTQHGFTASRSVEQVSRSGAVFRIEQRNADYLARWISTVAIYPCAGSRDPAGEALLSGALSQGRWKEVTRLYRHDQIPSEQSWLRTPTWSLAYH